MLKLIVKPIFAILRLVFKSRNNIILENLALRWQLAIQKRNIKKPKLNNSVRIFWVWLSKT